MNRLFKHIIIGWLGIVSVMTAAKDISVSAYLDQTEVPQHQQFTLTVELSGEGANQAENPQLPEMDRFASFLGSGSSQNIQFVNGKMSVSKVLSFHFQATEAGTQTIGPVIVQYDGKKYTTDPITLTILKAQGGRPAAAQPRTEAPEQGASAARDDLFIEAVADQKRVYQNEPVTLTYKIYTRLQISSFGIANEPAITGFWKEDFELPPQPVTKSEVINGKQYTTAVIRKQALYPMTPGLKEIEPLVINCEVRAQRKSRDPFDSFFNDPFFGRTEQVRVPSNPVKITVMPLPEEGKPSGFNGAVGQFTLKGWVDKTQVKTNDAITYKVRVEGQGNVHALLDPQIDFSSDFESYPPKVNETIQRKNPPISGSKVYEYVLIPRFPGVQKITPVTFSYFDSGAKKYKTLKTDTIEIQVAQGEETFSLVPAGATKEEVKWRGKDIRFIKSGPADFSRIDSVFYQAFWFWICLLFPVFGLIGAAGYRRHLNRLHGDVAYARERRAGRAAKRRLSCARTLLKEDSQKAFYAEAGKALTGFLGDKLNIAEAGMISEEVKAELTKRGVNSEIIGEVFSILAHCDSQRFAPSDASADKMHDFLKRAETAMSLLDRALRK